MLSEHIILEKLNTLHEHTMAKEVFVPLLKKMGLKGVKFTGGSSEEGIDIEYYELTDPEKEKRYVGIQFKKGDIKYSSGGNKGTITNLRYQAEEAFNKEICDENSASVYYIGRFVVATTGVINEQSRKYINKVKRKGNDRNIGYWDGERLAEYINNYWLEGFIDYFNIDNDLESEYIDEDDIIVDEEYIEENYEKEVNHCRKIRATVDKPSWEILKSVLSVTTFEGEGSAGFDEFLLELGRCQDNIHEEMKNLIGRLNYLDMDDNDIFLSGQATCLCTLVDIIYDELEGAEEDLNKCHEIFDKLLS